MERTQNTKADLEELVSFQLKNLTACMTSLAL
jgi:hypothetical protein